MTTQSPTTQNPAPRVAIFDEFLDAFARIPRAQQKKVSKFLRNFRENPTSPSIHYEPIAGFADPNLRTVRIDLAYRAIVLQPEAGNIFVLLWVDHHDEAMRWAENKRVAIHPETGSIQVLALGAPETAIQSSERVPEDSAPASEELFAAIRDRELLRIGVPESQLGAVRAVVGRRQLERLGAWLPPEAFEALYWLAEGESLDEVERAMAASRPETVDPEDFGTALGRDVSRRRFVEVEDDASLESMLDAPLERWRVFLHPSQRSLVERIWNGPVRVLGGAGTGKSVVAIHRAAYLAEKVFTDPSDRILFTTFTRNLAADTAVLLERVCSADALARIEVMHLDGWVRDLLRRAGYRYEIRWWEQGERLEELWQLALALDSSSGFSAVFLREEWEAVVQPAGCETWDDYRAASRSGRGTPLTRRQRKSLWPVFEEYRHQLERHKLREPEDAMRDAAALLARGEVEVSLRAIVVDEAQDLSTHAFRLLRAAIPTERPNDLFIVGDGHQRIYRKRVVLSHAGVEIRGRARRLRINYRTTDEIRRYAVALLEGVDIDDLDGGSDSVRGYRSLTHGVPPEVLTLADFEDEVEAIARWLSGVDLSRCCLALRTKKLAQAYAAAMEDRGIEIRHVRSNVAEDHRQPGLRVATMHRVKGLEFDRMVLAGMNEDEVPLRWLIERSDDPAVRRETELMERALLYVALTRAREAVLITGYGRLSAWIDR